MAGRTRKFSSWRWVVAAALALLILSVGAAAVLGFHYYREIRKDLPDVSQLRDYRPSLITKVYADSGDVIGQFFIEKRILLPRDQIPELLIKAFLAIEDARFYQHRGIDLQGISRAFWANLRAKQITQGGSTITQQLAKTLFLSPERTVRRKLKEMILALEIERRFSKDEILELYLNQIYFGEGSYGVEAAAETYFGKPAADLRLAEMALLAGLPKAPNRFDPLKDPEAARTRRSVVLARMQGEHFITPEEREAADQEPILLKEKETCRDVSAYFVEHVRRYLMEHYGSRKLYRSGLEVHTTLNLEMQQAATRALREGLRAYDKRHGYRGPLETVSLDQIPEEPPPAPPESGEETGGSPPEAPKPVCVDDILEGWVVDVNQEGAEVRVMGETGFLPFQELRWAKRAVPGDDPDDPEAVRWIEPRTPMDVLSVGDRILVRVLKSDPDADPPELLLSLEQEPDVQGALVALDPATGEIKAMVGGYDYEKSEFNRAVQARRQPGSSFKPIIYGAAMQKGFSPATVVIDTPIIFQDPQMEEKWKPANYSEKFYGPTRLRVALAKSRNVVTIKVLQKVGIGNVVDFAERLGISSPLARDYSLALGSSGVTLLELTSAYGVYANRGKRAAPIFIRQILDYDGNIVEENEPVVEQVLDPDVAYVMTSMLQDVVKHGTGRQMLRLGRPSAGKTGTTNNFLDALYIGFVPDLVTGVWVGYDDMKSLGKRETGAKAAAPIWLSFMQQATRGREKLPFPASPGIVFVRVDAESGLLPSAAGTETYFECFRKGSEPRDYAPVHKAAASDFFDMDGNAFRPPPSREVPAGGGAPDRL